MHFYFRNWHCGAVVFICEIEYKITNDSSEVEAVYSQNATGEPLSKVTVWEKGERVFL